MFCILFYLLVLNIILQEISQTVRLLPNPLPSITVEITPMCEKYVTSYNCTYVHANSNNAHL